MSGRCVSGAVVSFRTSCFGSTLSEERNGMCILPNWVFWVFFTEPCRSALCVKLLLYISGVLRCLPEVKTELFVLLLAVPVWIQNN